ncbi:murein L,D-transpeptidase [Paracoccus sp. SCSIO 75233]|uniref:L,D-transpeptidase family protein n=1 Tax=Paracoccus sp. SCSIO 75233 TaxID=3017782 RepID=UPI0022F11418|nr:L,D-transpeptidase family protein [Paracoccus sp. SCSIO 75233]WBU54273.1 L,D-transpeptidase family protein [Paracoccus sp. SCSIO 75233]
MSGHVTNAAPAPKLEFTDFEMQLAQTVASDPGLAAFYGANALKPVFTGPESEARRQALLDAIKSAPEHGLPSARYDLAALSEMGGADDAVAEVRFANALSRWADDVGNGIVDPRKTGRMNVREVVPVDMAALLDGMLSDDPAAALDALPPQNPAYLRLKELLSEHLTLVPPADAPQVASGLYKLGVTGPEVAKLRERLASIGFTPEVVPADPEIYDEGLAQLVSDYQQATGLPADGVAGPQTIGKLRDGLTGPEVRRLMIAMERMRWLNGHDLSKRMIWVNIPSYMAEVLEDGQPVFQTRAVVGKSDPEWQTPEFSDTMEFVVPNPYWNVPRSITAATYLPQLQANPNAAGHLEVVDRNGRPVSRDSINFNKYNGSNFPYFLRQKPSDSNALGLVKFMFPNRWNIYLHDTPSKGLFSDSSRAASHGCVRLRDPFDFATLLLRGNSSDPRGYFQQALSTGKERWIKLEEPLPVHLVYFTTIPGPDGQLRNYRDVYGRDAGVWAAIQKAAEAGS